MRLPGISSSPDALLQDWRTAQSESRHHPARHFVLNGELVTPLFGGGVDAGQVDQEHPIRATGIIGQLRHWWRMTCGESDPAILFKRETAIWGGISREGPTASKVQIAVQTLGKVKVDRIPQHNYATFPARESTRPPRQAEKPMGQPGLRFQLTMTLDPRLPDAAVHEIQTAIRWWASFGGIGARTRRGLGAVRMQSDGPQDWLTPVSAGEVLALGGQLCLRDPAQRQGTPMPISAWTDGISRLQHFRQGVSIGRNPGKERNRPGRSRWPEPDILRRETGRTRHHAPMHPVKEFFPRAAFGLPIVFHFQAPGRGMEPDDSSLEPVGHDRLASPLVLRPYWNGTHWLSAALLLPGWKKALDGTVTSASVKPTPVWPKSETEREAVAGRISPMQGRGTDPLSAFMAFFMEGAGS